MITFHDLEDRERSILAAKGSVCVVSLAELRAIITGWKGAVRRYQDAENELAGKIALRTEVEEMLGLEPGETFDPDKLDEAIRQLRSVAVQARERARIEEVA